MSFARFGMRAFLLAAAVTLSPLTPSAVQAQSFESPGPTMSAAAVGARRSVSADALDARDAAAPLQRRGSAGQAAALMIVGGAAVVVGLLAGGDVVGPLLVLGGAVVGLYGLYLYLQ